MSKRGLTENQLKAIQMLIEDEKTRVQIAKDLKINRKTLYNWMNNEDFRREWEASIQRFKNFIAAESETKFLAYTDMAIETLINLMKTSDNVETKRKCAIEILERTQGKISTKVEVDNKEDDKNNNKDSILGNIYNKKKNE